MVAGPVVVVFPENAHLLGFVLCEYALFERGGGSGGGDHIRMSLGKLKRMSRGYCRRQGMKRAHGHGSVEVQSISGSWDL